MEKNSQNQTYLINTSNTSGTLNIITSIIINQNFQNNEKTILEGNQTGSLALILMFSLCGIASAKDYLPIVRYDRIWESVSISRDFLNTVKYIKFDGECEINGKTYHKLVTFNKTLVDWGATAEDTKYTYLGEVNEHEGYLREENGRVYTLVTGEYLDGDFDYFQGTLFCSDEIEPDKPLQEVLIYDFNCEDGGNLTVFSNNDHVGRFVDLTNITKTSITVGGEERAVLKLGFTDVVEGIGQTTYGTLNYTVCDIPTRVWAHNYFNRLFDLQGNLIYVGPEALDYDLPGGVFSSVGTVIDKKNLLIGEREIIFGQDNDNNALNIFDVNGRLVRSMSGMGRLCVSIEGLQPGIYVISANANGREMITRKFISGCSN